MQAVRAIIIQGSNILVMRRKKEGSEYYTLVGGRVKEAEDKGRAIHREVMEETGLEVTSSRLVFVEKHPEPYNEQYIYLCNIKNFQQVTIQNYSEEAMLNKLGYNIHDPYWVNLKSFEYLAFRTPQLQQAIVKGLKNGFPAQEQVI